MGEIIYSDEQLRVINTRGKNILVSAAAGSGKTTVLVERIIKKITDKDAPVDIDRILVLTFTESAAAEMRSRIENALETALAADPDNEQLLRQSVLIHNAQISTIHGFCLSLIHNNFSEIGIDPSFRVAETGEIKLLEAKVADELIEEMFESEQAEKILLLADRFAASGSLNGLKDIIIGTYGVCRNNPFVREYIKERENDYLLDDIDALFDTAWGRELKDTTDKLLKQARGLTEYNIALTESTGGPFMYRDALQSDLDLIGQTEGAHTYSEYYSILRKPDFARLSSKKSPDVSDESKELSKFYRECVKSILSDLSKHFFCLPEEAILKEMRANRDITEALAYTLLKYDSKLEAEKQRRKIIDFSDMEHYALRILLTKENGEYVPSRCALDYRDIYDEIMVDEYQDSNLVQEKILEAISGDDIAKYNRFMVGDVKQSIYSFRKACPELFMEKYEIYNADDIGVRIDLSANYRSRKEVVDSINYVFERIMAKDLGGIAYDNEARLNAGAKYPENDEDHTTEFIIAESDKNSKKSKVEQEAECVANRIRELVGKYTVCEKECMRPCRYSDIVILLRSGKNVSDVFYDVLNRNGIPAFVSSKTGYFDTREIKDLLNLLLVLDNPRSEIELYGVLTGVFGGFDEEEIALIRSMDKCELYDAIKAISEGGFEGQDRITDVIKNKSAAFMSFLNEYRDKVVYTPINELLENIIDHSGYIYHILSLPYGDQRKANVYMLIEKAKQYEKGSFKGLHHFISYINEIQSYEIDYGEASVIDEHADVVRIMTIHKSKGLEFPVCFVSGMNKGMNFRSTSEKVLFDRQLGLGLEYVDTLRNVKHTDLRYSVLAWHMRMDSLAEEMRVLYVAMTRAKEKLIMTACMDDPAGEMEKWSNLRLDTSEADGKELSYTTRSSFLKFSDILLAAADEKSPIRIITVRADDALSGAVKAGLSKEIRKQRLKEDVEALLATGHAECMDKNVKNKITFKYPHKNLEQLYTKTSVSELKINAILEKLSQDEIEDLPDKFFTEHETEKYVPTFVSDEKKISGTTRGTAYHRVMELFDFKGAVGFRDLDPESQHALVTDVIEDQVSSGRIDRDNAGLVDKNKVISFLCSDLGDRMCRAATAGRLTLEQPFVLGISADRLKKEFPKEETVLIQGIIDAFFVENDEIVLMDYKTDAVSSAQALADRYELQLDYYKEALERITGLKVKQKLIYSFALNMTIEL